MKTVMDVAKIKQDSYDLGRKEQLEDDIHELRKVILDTVFEGNDRIALQKIVEWMNLKLAD